MFIEVFIGDNIVVSESLEATHFRWAFWFLYRVALLALEASELIVEVDDIEDLLIAKSLVLESVRGVAYFVLGEGVEHVVFFYTTEVVLILRIIVFLQDGVVDIFGDFDHGLGEDGSELLFEL